MIDAISLSLGYYDETWSDVQYSSGLRTVIDKLLDLGVPVFAAAGNNSSGRRFYPAAFAAWPGTAGHPAGGQRGRVEPERDARDVQR